MKSCRQLLLVLTLTLFGCSTSWRDLRRDPSAAGQFCKDYAQQVLDSPKVAARHLPQAYRDLIRRPWKVASETEQMIQNYAAKGEVPAVVYLLLENRLKGYAPPVREKILRRIYDVVQLDESRFAGRGPFYSLYAGRIHLPDLHPWTRAYVIGHEGRHAVGYLSPTLSYLDMLAKLFLPLREFLSFPFVNLREASAIGFEWEVLSRLPRKVIDDWRALARQEVQGATSESKKIALALTFFALEHAHLSKSEFTQQMMELRGYTPLRWFAIAAKQTSQSPWEWAKILTAAGLLYYFDPFSHTDFEDARQLIRDEFPAELAAETKLVTEEAQNEVDLPKK